MSDSVTPQPAAEPTPATGPGGRTRTRVRRERGALESLLSIVLVIEALLVFFVALAVFGLRSLDPVTALVGGFVFMVVLAASALAVRWTWGVAVGWVLQAAILATGILVPLMLVIGAGFLTLWIYCFVRGRALDRAKADHLAHEAATPKENAS